MTINGTTVSDVTVEADLRDLSRTTASATGGSASSGLESDQFPQAKFVLTEPITLTSVPDGRRDDHGRGHGRLHPARRHQDG